MNRMFVTSALIAAALVFPAGADAAITFGVGFESTPNATQQTASIRATGAKEVRVDFNWATIEARQGQYNWQQPDNTVADAAHAGLRVLPIPYHTPCCWIYPGTTYPTTAAPPANVYATFLRQVALRYGYNGTFWRVHPELTYLPILSYEIWNEPNWTFWTGRPDQYAALYRAARDTLHSLGPYRAILGGMAPKDEFGWLRYIYPQLGQVDAVGYHPYSDTADGTLALVTRMLRTIKSLGSSATLDITEVGWPTPPYTERARALNLRQLTSEIQTRPYRRVRRLDVFMWGTDSQFRIANPDGSWKPSATGFAWGIKHSAQSKKVK